MRLTGSMTEIESRAAGYVWQLLRFANASPRSKSCFLHTLQNAGYVLAITESSRILIQIDTADKLEITDSKGLVIPPGNADAPSLVVLSNQSIEQTLFPGITDPSEPAGMTVGERWVVLDGLAFASPRFAKKYWSEVAFSRHCAKDLPIRVTENGCLLGIELLYGWEEEEEAQLRLIQIARVFGSSDMLPETAQDIESLAWSDFTRGLLGARPTLDNWSFANHLKSLAAPAAASVLVLGSYRVDSAIEEAATALRGLGYTPILLRDAPDLPFQTNTEKFLAGVMCSAFVVVVDTEPSGHLSELTHLLDLRLRPVLVLRHKMDPSSCFLEDRIKTDPLFRVAAMPAFSPQSIAGLTAWARTEMEQRVKDLNGINHWRSRASS